MFSGLLELAAFLIQKALLIVLVSSQIKECKAFSFSVRQWTWPGQLAVTLVRRVTRRSGTQPMNRWRLCWVMGVTWPKLIVIQSPRRVFLKLHKEHRSILVGQDGMYGSNPDQGRSRPICSSVVWARCVLQLVELGAKNAVRPRRQLSRRVMARQI